MDFKTATDRLTRCVTLSDLAAAAKVSDATIRRARLERGTSAFRNPPANWRTVAADLAEQRAEELARLASELRTHVPT
jgi:hypothetical protein